MNNEEIDKRIKKNVLPDREVWSSSRRELLLASWHRRGETQPVRLVGGTTPVTLPIDRRRALWAWGGVGSLPGSRVNSWNFRWRRDSASCVASTSGASHAGPATGTPARTCCVFKSNPKLGSMAIQSSALNSWPETKSSCTPEYHHSLSGRRLTTSAYQTQCAPAALSQSSQFQWMIYDNCNIKLFNTQRWSFLKLRIRSSCRVETQFQTLVDNHWLNGSFFIAAFGWFPSRCAIKYQFAFLQPISVRFTRHWKAAILLSTLSTE